MTVLMTCPASQPFDLGAGPRRPGNDEGATGSADDEDDAEQDVAMAGLILGDWADQLLSQSLAGDDTGGEDDDDDDDDDDDEFLASIGASRDPDRATKGLGDFSTISAAINRDYEEKAYARYKQVRPP
jgi:hypothetical protein